MKGQTLGEQDTDLLRNSTECSGASHRRLTLTVEVTGRRAALSSLGRGDHASTLLGRPARGLLPFEIQKGVFFANGNFQWLCFLIKRLLNKRILNSVGTRERRRRKETKPKAQHGDSP